MGVVYRAHDPEIDRAVAIKLIRADLLSGDAREQYLQRFRREAQAAGRCTHPNIVALHDISADVAGNPFLVMEYVEGTSLYRLLALGRRLSVEQAVSMTSQILDALAAAHALGVVHRDIKPANILLRDGLRVKVTDFGISRIIASDMTTDGAVIGTPSYMSPEQIQGDEAGPASDLFSVASLFHESMTGEKAFSGDSLAALAMKLIQQPTPPIPGLPAPLQAVLDRAHAKRPEDRFASAEAMAQALRTAAQARATEGAIGGAIEGATVVLPGGATPSGIGALLLEPGREAAIEALMVSYVGPIAKHLLQRAARCRLARNPVRGLAAQIGDQEQSQEFVRRANAILRGAGAVAEPEFRIPELGIRALHASHVGDPRGGPRPRHQRPRPPCRPDRVPSSSPAPPPPPRPSNNSALPSPRTSPRARSAARSSRGDRDRAPAGCGDAA